MSSRTPPKRKPSERRKLQNKVAQKSYRERQKKHLLLLQDLAGYDKGVALNAQVDKIASKESSEVSRVSCLPSPPPEKASDRAATSTPGNDHQAPIKQHHVSPELQLAQYDGAWNQLQQRMGSPESPQKHKKPDGGASQLENTSSIEAAMNQLLMKNFTVQDILEAGVKALSQRGVKAQSPEHLDSSPQDVPTSLRKIVKLQSQEQAFGHYLPNIFRNNLRVNQINLVAACVANLGMLGFTLSALANEDTESCFYTANQNTAMSSNDYTLLKPDLQPTQAQLLHGHHPYIDCLPFPDFRERLIKIMAVDPQIEYDFCADLEKDGLICWGSTLGSQSDGAGFGAPWDMRSWEAQSWFIKKWWFLVDGPDSDIYKQSRWWCEMRGERLTYP